MKDEQLRCDVYVFRTYFNFEEILAKRKGDVMGSAWSQALSEKKHEKEGTL
jgi:hypothetical protein